MEVDSGQQEERELYTFGQNAQGELGLGDSLERRKPTVSEACLGKDIVQVTAGNEHTAVLTNTGEVYCCGYNSEGQCGIGYVDGGIPERVPSFTKVILDEPSYSSGGRVALVHSSNGCEHLLIVTEEGDLRTCGTNIAGQLGHGDIAKGYCVPKPVAHLSGYKVAKVACSYNHTVVVTEDDRTWTFGGNDYGQLGHGDCIQRLIPTPVACLQGVGVLSIACGLSHTVISVTGGGMFAFGKNDKGQLGMEGGGKRHLPIRVPSFTAVVKQVACGYAHTLALTASGEVYAFGRNDYGQLGLGHVEDTWQPSLIPDLAGKVIVQVACGSYHTVSLDADGRVYPFGRNNHGQLGTGTKQDSCRPCFVEKLLDKFVCQVAAGFYHTACLTGPAISGLGGSRQAKSLSSDLYRLLNNPSRSDVTFAVEGKIVYGHRCVIGARCEPLERMLDGPMKEASSDGGSIALPNHRHSIFLAFLEFLYTDKVMALGADYLDLEFALDLLDVGDQYLVDALKRLCEKAILKNITADNACELIVTADARQALSLRNRCFEYIIRHLGLVSSTDAFGSLPPSMKKEIDVAAAAEIARSTQLARTTRSSSAVLMCQSPGKYR